MTMIRNCEKPKNPYMRYLLLGKLCKGMLPKKYRFFKNF